MRTQKKLFKDSSFSRGYGGTLLKKRKNRIHGRPLDTRHSMHLVLRSSKAKGPWSFKVPSNDAQISKIMIRFAFVNGVTILSMANVGNHLHLQIKLSNRFGYKPFIRAVTSAIAMSITGCNRWTKKTKEKLKFWDYRPFTQVLKSYRALLNLKDYIQINILEGLGCRRSEARMIWLQTPSPADSS